MSKLLSLFDKYAYTKSSATAFTELLDMILVPFKIYASQEEREFAITKLSTNLRKEIFVSIATLIGELSEGFRDPLGDLFMLKNISNDRMGQFFTPEPICDFMAHCIADSAKDGSRIFDPTCGSGRMLLSGAKINRYVVLFGADIDPVCCKMAVINMLLQSLTGEIAHMNSLSNEFYTGYHIGTTLSNGYYCPWYREFTNPEESAIWMKPTVKAEIVFPGKTNENYLQGVLF